MKRIVYLLSAWTICSHAYATSAVTGTVTHVRVDANGRGMVSFSGTISGSPSCISSVYNNTFAFDATTYGGRDFLSLALASQASGTQLIAYGLGTCSIYGSGTAEDFLSANS